jgi:hypothetical protein
MLCDELRQPSNLIVRKYTGVEECVRTRPPTRLVKSVIQKNEEPQTVPRNFVGHSTHAQFLRVLPQELAPVITPTPKRHGLRALSAEYEPH